LRKRWFCHERLWEAARNGTIEILATFITLAQQSTSAVPNLRSRPTSGSRGVWRRVARGFYGELDNYE